MDQTIEHEEAKRPKFLLQRYVEGIEVSTERWYSHGRAVEALDNSTIEAKKFLAGELGCAVGCAGNIVLPHHDLGLLRETVAFLDRLALAHGLTTPIDLNTIVADEDGHAYLLEVTSRFGYYALQAFVALWGMPIGETLMALAEGELPQVGYTARIGAAVPVSVAPYPAKIEHERGTPVIDEVIDLDNVWAVDVMRDDQGRTVIAGVDGVVYVVTGTGDTVAAALGECYRHLKKARMPDRQYRIDLVEALGARLEGLQRAGYLARTSERRVA